MHLGKEVHWDDEGLRAELAWTRRVLTIVCTVGQRIVTDYDPSVIETYPLGYCLVLAQFRYPGGNMESATMRER